MQPFIDQAAVQPTPATDYVHYERRRPEETSLYQLVQENVETFFAQVEAETGAGLPDFVKDEFDAFLDCGILANGFVRVRCEDCADEKLVAFSCRAATLSRVQPVSPPKMTRTTMPQDQRQRLIRLILHQGRDGCSS